MSWEDLFRDNAVADVRVRYSQLLQEKSRFHKEASTLLGASYPEILELCSSIRELTPSAKEHQKRIYDLSSVENTNRWARIQENTEKYAQSESNEVRSRALASLKASLLDQLEIAVSSRELLQASRISYLLEVLGSAPSSTVLDDKLNQWLEQPSADNDVILGYILRYKVSPSELAAKLAEQRLLKLSRLDILPAVELVDQTTFTLEYIADYDLKFKKSSAKLVDVLDVDRTILPAAATEAPLYPPQCFERAESFKQSDFSAKAKAILVESAQAVLATSSAAQVVQTWSALLRDAPALAASVRESCKRRIEELVRQLSASLTSIELPKTIEQEPLSMHDLAAVTKIVERAAGEWGNMKEPLQKTRKWLADFDELEAQIQSLAPLKSREPAVGPMCEALSATMAEEKLKAINSKLENLSTSAAVNILFVKALQPTSPKLKGLYTQLCREICDEWTLETSKARIPPFPTKGLLRSLANLVELIDNVPAGIEWDETACEIMRGVALEKLKDDFSDEVSFLESALGKSQEQASVVARIRTLLSPLVV